MGKIIVDSKRLTPRETVSLVRDSVTRERVWKHRYITVYNSKQFQETKVYPFSDFKSLTLFASFIEKQKPYKHQIKI